MENLRWILIAAGVAILVLLYFSGRPRRGGSHSRQRRYHDHLPDLDDGRIGAPYGSDLGRSERGRAGRDGMGLDADPLLGEPPMADHYAGFDEVHPDDFVRPGSSAPVRDGERLRSPVPDYDYEYDFEDLDKPAGSRTATGGIAGLSGFSSFTQKFEAFSERLSPRRRKLVAQSEPADLDPDSAGDPKYASKIITLHVVAPPNSMLEGEHLLHVFEQRGYHFGELNIFHSMHEGNTVFSVAKMIEPGSFDIDDMASFQTPGITLILQLPGPVPADVAFEVLVSEAYEMARELGAAVLDDQHSTLTKQTVQHLRDGIYEYMHRQKYFGTVPS